MGIVIPALLPYTLRPKDAEYREACLISHRIATLKPITRTNSSILRAILISGKIYYFPENYDALI
jgi:hypothetical protein